MKLNVKTTQPRPHLRRKYLHGDLTGRIFGLLRVQYRFDPENLRDTWMCKCQCGNYTKQTHAQLMGPKPSCGCLKTVRQHSLFSDEYRQTRRAWRDMKTRCQKHPATKHPNIVYTYDPSWESFDNFLRDMGYKSLQHGLVRHDHSKPHSKENSYWGNTRCKKS